MQQSEIILKEGVLISVESLFIYKEMWYSVTLTFVLVVNVSVE